MTLSASKAPQSLVSTRGEAPALGFSDALLAGLARDGGLYWPEQFPRLSSDTISGFAGQSYQAIARAVLKPFATDIAPDALDTMIDEAYARGVSVDAAQLSAELGIPVVEMVAVDGRGLAELREALPAATLPARAGA